MFSFSSSRLESHRVKEFSRLPFQKLFLKGVKNSSKSNFSLLYCSHICAKKELSLMVCTPKLCYIIWWNHTWWKFYHVSSETQQRLKADYVAVLYICWLAVMCKQIVAVGSTSVNRPGKPPWLRNLIVHVIWCFMQISVLFWENRETCSSIWTQVPQEQASALFYLCHWWRQIFFTHTFLQKVLTLGGGVPGAGKRSSCHTAAP